MTELITEYLNGAYYLSAVDNAAYMVENDKPISFANIESVVTRMFGLDEDWAYGLVFNWLLLGGIKLVRKNWNKDYVVSNSGVYTRYEMTLTHDVDFQYKLVIDE